MLIAEVILSETSRDKTVGSGIRRYYFEKALG
jgi:hypothetical protein